MSRTTSFILRLLLALILLAGVLGVIAFAFQAGYSRGYVIGAATEGEGLPAASGYWAYPRMMMPYFGMHFFPPVGLFFCGSLLFVVFLGLFMRPMFWHRHHDLKEYAHGPWAHHWAHEHPCGPEHAPEHATENKAESNPPGATS